MTLEERHSQVKNLTMRIRSLEAERYALQKACPHEIIVPPNFYEKLKEDQWHSASAICKGCDTHFGWFCPNSPDHICNYKHESGRYDGICRYCGMPDERK